MKTYLIKWADGTISILTAKTDYELWLYADREGDVFDPSVRAYKLPKKFHLGTCINKKGKIEGKLISPQTPLKRHRLNPKDI